METKELIIKIEEKLPELWSYIVTSWKINGKIKTLAKITFISGNDETIIVNQMVDTPEEGFRFIYSYLSNYKNNQ